MTNENRISQRNRSELISLVPIESSSPSAANFVLSFMTSDVWKELKMRLGLGCL